MRTATTRTISGRVNSDGSIAGGSEFVVQKTALGQYVLTFPGQRLRGLTANGANPAATPLFVMVDTFTTSSCRAVATNAASTAQVDANFNFTATVAA